jgi:glutathione synthase/RimK-type ligase-like ATP-grasp enzyme
MISHAAAQGTKKVVVVATLHWATTTRLCLALAGAGFEVTALTPSDHALPGFSSVRTRPLGRTRNEALRRIAQAFHDIVPDIVIPADERAISFLRMLYARAIPGKSPRALELARLIEASLGASSTFMLACQKSQFIELARQEGLPVPKTKVIGDVIQLRKQIAKARLPVVLKRDRSWGGAGVRIVSNVVDAEESFLALRAAAGPLAAVKQALRKLDVSYLDRLYRSGPAITLQEYIRGWPANRAVVCHRGQVLAGLSVEVLQTSDPAGPASVIRVIDSQEMKDVAAHIVRRLDLSGFVGFDFMIEAASGRPYLIEMNGRPTQICHLKVDADSDMLGALAARLSATPPLPTIPNVVGHTIALFPQETWRDPDSHFLTSAFHDIPREIPEYVAAYANCVPEEPADWTRILRRHFFGARHSVPSSASNQASSPRGIPCGQTQTPARSWQHY